MLHPNLDMGYQVPNACKPRQMSASNVSELLREQNQSFVVPGSFPTGTECFTSGDNYIWHEWQICFLFEGNKVHSQFFTFQWAANLLWSSADESKKELFLNDEGQGILAQ